MWEINKGIGRTVEFKGLKSQYLFIFAGGLLATFILVVICYMCGMNQYLCLGMGVSGATLVVWQTFAMNRKYGEHGQPLAGIPVTCSLAVLSAVFFPSGL